MRQNCYIKAIVPRNNMQIFQLYVAFPKIKSLFCKICYIVFFTVFSSNPPINNLSSQCFYLLCPAYSSSIFFLTCFSLAIHRRNFLSLLVLYIFFYNAKYDNLWQKKMFYFLYLTTSPLYISLITPIYIIWCRKTINYWSIDASLLCSWIGHFKSSYFLLKKSCILIPPAVSTYPFL